jgi:hypothetical protein
MPSGEIFSVRTTAGNSKLMPTPRVLKVHLARAENTSDPYKFNGKPQRYIFLSEHGGCGEALFPWDEVSRDIEEFMSEQPRLNAQRRLGAKLREFLERLLSSGKGWAAYAEELLQAEKKRQRIHLLFRFNAVELFALPWSLTELKDGQCLGALPHCVVQFEWARQDPATEVSIKPGRLVFAWSGARKSVPDELHRDALREACVPLEWEELEDVTLERLEEALKKAEQGGNPVRILHILCHGSELSDGSFALVWSAPSSQGGSAEVTGFNLARVLRPYMQTLQLVVLSACYGGNPGRAGSMFGGVAHDLHRLGIPVVIASQRPLSWGGSALMTKAFYRALCTANSSVYEAFQTARAALPALSLDWASLQLFAPWQAPAGTRAHPRPIGQRVMFSGTEALPDLGTGELVVAYEVNLTIPATPVIENLEAPAEGELNTAVLRPLAKVSDGLPEKLAEWKKAFREADRFVDTLEEREAQANIRPVVHLFGCAPLPLMFHLGWRLGRRPLRVYQQNRQQGDTWPLGHDSSLLSDEGEPFFRIESWPELEACRAAGGRLAVTVEVTRRISDGVLAQWLGSGGSAPPVVRLVVAEPSPTAVKGPMDTTRGVDEFRKCLDRIHDELPEVREVLLALVCPASFAAALGRAFNPKAQPALQLFNFRPPEGYVPVHRLGGKPRPPRRS